jgi:ribosomal protein S18 acetylase RimI-like enzyme
LNKEKNKLDIKNIAEKWDISGAVSVYHKGEQIFKDFFGLANHETGEKINEESTYLLSGSARFLLSLSILMLSDMKKLNLNDTVDKYIPEYTNGHKIKIKHLLLGESGIRDYFFGKIMLELKNDEKHNSLEERERYVEEKRMYTKNYSFEEVLKLIGNDELEFEPGEDLENDSTTENVFCKEIIERVSGMKLLDFEFKYIFEVLNMSQTRKGRAVNTNTYSCFRDKEMLLVNIDETAEDLFVTTSTDIEKLMLALYEGIVLSSKNLLSKKSWKEATKFNDESVSLIFSTVNGTISVDKFTLLGNEVSLYINKEFELCYMQLSNANLKIENIGGTWMYFRKDLRNEIDEIYTYPKNTRIVPYNKKNWYDIMNLEISKDQYEFVCDAKQSIAYTFANQTECKLFAAMEGDKPVGLMVLKVNKKKNEYHFDILLVDKRYQGKGYGKIMIQYALEYFKKQGAKELTIGVNRFNISAQRLYKSVGFKEDLVYEEGMLLKMSL